MDKYNIGTMSFKKDGKIYADDILIYENGKFII